MKFVLFAGFHAGLRKEEIVMARPSWFRLELGHIAVPAMQRVEGRFWEVKSKRARKIPLTPEFRKFLQDEFQGWETQDYMLHPEANGQRYRWDFRRPFEEFMATHGLWRKNSESNVSPHSMRHSYITHLADQGYSAAQISAWSGDRIRTLETNYLHTAAPDGAVDRLYRQKDGTQEALIAQLIEEVQQLRLKEEGPALTTNSARLGPVQ